MFCAAESQQARLWWQAPRLQPRRASVAAPRTPEWPLAWARRAPGATCARRRSAARACTSTAEGAWWTA
eukprot:14685989-Alexandrium_andersonii.AAC.1